MTIIYLGLGANLGDRAANIQEAIDRLKECGLTIRAVSPMYETEPWGIADQPRFLNAACAIETTLSPQQMLILLKGIEKAMGRESTARNGPRPIDLDILLFGDLVLDTRRLTIPHPGLIERATALVPLADIAARVRHPQTGLDVAEHLGRLGSTPDVAPYPPGLSGEQEIQRIRGL